MIFDDDEIDDLERIGTAIRDGILVMIGIGLFFAVMVVWY